MKKMPPNIDGFSIQRRGQTPGGSRRPSMDQFQIPAQYLVDSHSQKSVVQAADVDKKTSARSLGQIAATSEGAADKPSRLGEIDISLPNEQPTTTRKKRWLRVKSPKKVAKIVAIFLLVVGLIAGGFFAWRVISNANRVFSGNLFNAVFSNKPLKTDQYGRTNMVIFGTSEDDPGHAGASLTDSIIIASVDQKKKDAFLVSIPRDLWVKYGKACNAGYEGKVNEVYMCGIGRANDEAAGQTALRTTAGTIFGMDIQYSVRINYTVVRQAVDAVGGVDITIDSKDPRGILDRNFDWRCRYKCNFVKWPNGPAHLNGEKALFLAQARNESGGYGLPRGNFDREENQRKILIALKDKATSVGFLSNPLAVTQLLDSLGNNVRTNIDAEEIKSFINLAKEINTKNIHSLSLVDPENPLVTTGNVNGASIVRPVAGLYDYSKIHAFISAYLKGNGALLAEKALIDVLNGSGVPGMAQKQADLLEADGMVIDLVANAPEGAYTKVTWYDLSAGKKPATLAKLQKTLGIKPTGTVLPVGITSTSDFVIIIGTDGAN